MTHLLSLARGLTLFLPLLALGCEDKGDGDGNDDTGPDPSTDSGTEIIDSTPTGDDSGTTDSEDTAAEAQAAAEYAAFYDPAVIQDIELTLSPAAIESLKAAPDLWVAGDLRIGATSWTDVGVRLRGGVDGESWDGKPAFKLKLDEFEVDNDYAGLERIVLDNLEDDPSQIRLVLALGVLADAGLAVPRASFTTLHVNGEDYGLYANVEDVDGRFLDRHYPDADGDLWQGLDSADFTAAGVNHFETVNGDADRLALEDAARLVAGADFYASADTAIDMEQFLSYWSWLIVIGSADAYPYDLNDFYIYAHPEDDRFEFVPWMVDEGWDTGMHWENVEGTLALRCHTDVACLDALRASATEAILSFEAMDTATMAQRAADLVEGVVLTDPRRTVDVTEVARAQIALVDRLATWSDRVRGDMGL